MAAIRFLERTYSVLTANSAVAALIATRVYPDTLPQSVDLPACATRVVTERIIDTLSGPTELRLATVQVNCYARAFDDAQALADAVAAAMNAQAAHDFSAQQIGRRDLHDEAHGGLPSVSLDFSCFGKDA